MIRSTLPIATFFSLFLLFSSCSRDRLESGSTAAPSLVASMSELEAPAHFDWRTTEERTFILSLGNQAPSSEKYRLEWYIEHPSTGADLRHVALIDKNNPFVGKVTLPKYAEKVFIKLITPEAQSSIQEFAAGPTTSHTFFSGKRNMKMSAITSISQLGQDIDGEAAEDYSGTSVSLSSDGQTVAIGAYQNDGNGSSTGHVRVYSYNGSSWSQLGQDIDGEEAQDESGTSVSLSSDGQTVAIGAYQNDGNGTFSGHVRIYSFNGSTWNQIGQDIDGEAAGDESGTSVSLSSDGQTVAIGAPENDGNGSSSGHVRIYSYNGSSWIQVGQDIDGEAAEDRSGYSVSLSSDGQTVAIGAYQNDGNGSDAGHVRVYSLGSSTPGDSDGDGVADASDNYPNDATRAYDSFNPSENSFGTAMFEDLWPSEGDYDFNDVVVSWRQQLVSNADNKIVEVKIKVVKVARGGSLESGFGLKLGTVPSNKVASVTGCQLSGFASIDANGVEDGQTYANIIFWDKISQAWPNTTGASMQNTISANPHSTEDTTDIVVTFTEPIEGTLLNNGGPYIWVNNERGREIHPAGSAPTDKVDPSYFGTGSDNSDISDVTTMYKGNGNRPWALVIFEETAQTEEKVDFTEAYLKFSDWALSSGGSYNDWYKDETGYRGSSSKFYTK